MITIVNGKAVGTEWEVYQIALMTREDWTLQGAVNWLNAHPVSQDKHNYAVDHDDRLRRTGRGWGY